MNNHNKKFLASLIRDRKATLFGKFSDHLTHEMKINEWKIIQGILISQGIVSKDKDWKYLRNVLWQNLKRATMVKVDNAKKTGSAGGLTCKLSDLDDIIIDIISKESPILQGIEDESRCPPSCSSNNVEVDEGSTSAIQFIEMEREDNIRINKREKEKTKADRKRQHNSLEDTEIILLKKKRLQLEIYNLELDARKKEKELGLPVSSLTSGVERDASSPQVTRVLDFSEF